MITENFSSRRHKKSLRHILISCYLRHKIPLVCTVGEKFFPGRLGIDFWSWSLMIYPSMSWKKFYVYDVKYPPHTVPKSSRSTRFPSPHPSAVTITEMQQLSMQRQSTRLFEQRNSFATLRD